MFIQDSLIFFISMIVLFYVNFFSKVLFFCCFPNMHIISKVSHAPAFLHWIIEHTFTIASIWKQPKSLRIDEKINIGTAM